MIYSEKFVWLHFPKCAGTKIEVLFKKYYSSDKRIIQDPFDPQIDPLATWHDSISDRETRDPTFILGDRVVICSFRKLPSWLESRYSFELQRSPQLKRRPELLLEGKFLEPDGNEIHADFYARKYVPEQILTSGKLRFIRTEHFASDFKSIFGEFLDIAIIPNWEFRYRVNSSQSAIPNVMRKRLLKTQQELYKKCPYWRRVEAIAYE